MTFTFDASRGVSSRDVWSDDAFLCDSACVDFVAAGFYSSASVLAHRSNTLSARQNRP